MSKDSTSSSSSSSSSSSPLQSIATSSNIIRPNLTADEQRELNEQLFYAVTKKTENLTLVKKLINQGADVNAVNNYKNHSKYGNTPLHRAAFNGHTETAIVLLQNLANVNAVDEYYHSTPLHYAAENGHTETVIALLQNRANPNAVDKTRNTPLHFAAFNGHTKTVIVLLENRANPNAVDDYLSTPLHRVIQDGHTKTAIDLLNQNGADINALDVYIYTPAAERERTKTAIALLQKGANPNAVNRDGDTPLHFAASYGYTKIPTALLENGANPSARNNNNKAASDLAINGDTKSFLINCINFQKELKPIFDKMVKSFSEIKTARNGKEEVSASNPSTDLDETLKAVRNKFEEDGIDLILKNKNLFSPEFHLFNMALDDKGNSILHLMANEALKLGDGTERDQYLELLVTLAKKSGNEKVQKMIKSATTISTELRPLVASDIEEIIVSYLHDNDTKRTQASQTIIDDNLATALHLAANKGYLIASNQPTSSSTSLTNNPKEPGIMGRFFNAIFSSNLNTTFWRILNTIFCRNSAEEESYPATNMAAAASSSSTYSSSKEEEKSAPAARGNNPDNQTPATFVQSPSATATSSKDQQNQR